MRIGLPLLGGGMCLGILHGGAFVRVAVCWRRVCVCMCVGWFPLECTPPAGHSSLCPQEHVCVGVCALHFYFADARLIFGLRRTKANKRTKDNGQWTTTRAGQTLRSDFTAPVMRRYHFFLLNLSAQLRLPP